MSKAAASQQETATTESKFNKNPKRNNRKSKSKGQLDLNNEESEANNASRIYSEHYTEDIDTLLQFITSSAPPDPTANKNLKNKAAKQKPAAKQPAVKQETTTAAAATAKASKNQTKPDTDKLVKPAMQQPTDDKEKSEPSPSTEPAVTQTKAQPAVTAAVTQLVVEDEELNEQVALNNSGEFVTVKGRKLRKSTKKEVGPPVTQVKKENPTIVVPKNQVFAKPKPHIDSNDLSKKMPPTNAKPIVNTVKPKEEQIKLVFLRFCVIDRKEFKRFFF